MHHGGGVHSSGILSIRHRVLSYSPATTSADITSVQSLVPTLSHRAR